MAEDEQPRKRQRIDEDAQTIARIVKQEELPTSVEEAKRKAESEQHEQERKFGVIAFVTQSSAFSCIVKQRFTDFLVNEVDLTGKVAHLTAAPPSDASAEKQKPDPARPKQEAKATGEHLELQEENGKPSKENQSPAAAPEDLAAVQAIFGDTVLAFMQDLYAKIQSHPDKKPRDLPQHTSDPIEDKQQRTEAHVAVRKAFHGRIETNTGDDNRILIKAVAAPRQGYRQLAHKSNGAIAKGKVGWDELGGEYLHFTLYKENKDTMEVLYFIASQLKFHVKNFQFAGTKDRRGVTAQRVSAYRVTKEKLQSFNPRLKNARLCDFEYRKDALQLGDLLGNEFTIALRDVQVKARTKVEHAVESAVSALREHGFINYYGLQRFGSYNVSTDEVGKLMLQGDLKGAVDGILDFSEHLLDQAATPSSGNKFAQDDILRAEAIDAWRKTKKTGNVVEKMPRRFQAENAIIRQLGFVDRRTGKQPRSDDWQGALMQIPRNLRLMYVHAYQSLVWNAAAGKRQELYGNKVVEGDLVIITKEDSTDNAAVDDVDDDGEVIIRPSGEDSATAVEDKFERARALSKEEAESGKYTVFDIVLPQPGYDVLYPKNAVGDFFKEFMAKDGLDPHNMRRKWKEVSLSGSYRKFMARPDKVSHELKRYVEDDEQLLLTDMDKLDGRDLAMHDVDEGSKTAVIITMQLKSSQYATMALRELTKGGALAFKPEFSNR